MKILIFFLSIIFGIDLSSTFTIPKTKHSYAPDTMNSSRRFFNSYLLHKLSFSPLANKNWANIWSSLGIWLRNDDLGATPDTLDDYLGPTYLLIGLVFSWEYPSFLTVWPGVFSGLRLKRLLASLVSFGSDCSWSSISPNRVFAYCSSFVAASSFFSSICSSYLSSSSVTLSCSPTVTGCPSAISSSGRGINGTCSSF